MEAFIQLFLDLAALVKPRVHVLLRVLSLVVLRNSLLNLFQWNDRDIVPLVDRSELFKLAEGLRFASVSLSLWMFHFLGEIFPCDD